MLDYGTTAGEGLDCYTADGEDDVDDGSSSDRSKSYVTRDGGTTSNLPVHGHAAVRASR